MGGQEHGENVLLAIGLNQVGCNYQLVNAGLELVPVTRKDLLAVCFQPNTSCSQCCSFIAVAGKDIVCV